LFAPILKDRMTNRGSQIISETASIALNLAQAVLVLCYEIFLAHQREPMRIADCGLRIDINSDSEFPSPITHQPQPETLKPSPSASSDSEIRNPKSEISLASSFELEGMYRHLSEALQMMDFLDKQNPELWMMSLRRFFSRTGLYSNEVRMIRGICRQMKWFINRYRPQQDPLRPPDSEG